jgi:peptidoglycan/LPS O-acetylase OafA/YrhL
MGMLGKEKQAEQSGFRPDIEGLRGIAVLIVVAFHCRVSGFSGGFTGVDVSSSFPDT